MALTSYSTDHRPTAVGFAFGRAWYGGIAASKWSDYVFFSQVLTAPARFGLCMQAADPTAEEINSLVASDGGFITIPGLGQVYKMISLNTALVVLASNGIWAIFPGQEGFSPSSYSVQKISEEGAISRKGVVKVEDSVVFISGSGIYQCFFSRENGGLTIQSLSQAKIDTRYRYIPKEHKKNAIAAYDPSTKRLHFLFGTNNDYRLCLNYIFKSQAWYEYDYPDTSGRFNIIHVFAHRANTTGSDLRFLCKEETDEPGASFKYRFFFGDHIDASFKDWFGLYNYTSFLETPPLTLDNPQFKKQAMYLTTYFYKTESGYTEQLDESLTANTPSSCFLTTKWGWHDSDSGNKWSSPAQIYRMRREYTPDDASDTFDTGVSVVTTKSKVPGSGHSLSLRFEAEEGKDLRLIGYTLSLQMVGSY